MEEQKAVREELISAYDKNIVTRLKAELCVVAVDHNNSTYSYSQDTPNTNNGTYPFHLGLGGLEFVRFR